MQKIVSYVTCCVILHNLLIDFNNEDDDVDEWKDDLSDIDADDVLNRPIDESQPNDTRRTQLLQYLLERYDQVRFEPPPQPIRTPHPNR